VLRRGHRDNALEAVSETFLRALASVSSLRGGGDAFRAWLFRIARNVATDQLRRRARVVVSEMGDAVDPLATCPEHAVEDREDLAEIRRAFAALDADDREVLWLRLCAGLSSEHVAKIVGKRPGAVRMQQLRALQTLAALLPS
jgi:RNA polymerase sigma-70 factor (ECF subfamily)